MKRIAVSQRVDLHPSSGEARDGLDQRLTLFLMACACLSIPVPNLLSTSDILTSWLDALRPDGIVLSGGNDIGSCLERDATETTLLDWAKHNKKPVLGLCRGMQMMGVWAGGSLESVQGHVGARHCLDDELNREVNSFHHFSLASCPPGYQVLARADDGVIEAIRHQSLAWEGWMWHPERETAFQPQDLAMTRKLFGQ